MPVCPDMMLPRNSLLPTVREPSPGYLERSSVASTHSPMSSHPHVDQADGPIEAAAKPFNAVTLAKAEVTLGGWGLQS